MPQHRNKVRIIGGRWRSRLVEFPTVAGLRPTPDRVRETLFNWLQEEVAGSHCLDLFAGSGILGFEALSRGAAALVQVEQDGQVCHQLARSATALGCARVSPTAVKPALSRPDNPPRELAGAGPQVQCFAMAAADWLLGPPLPQQTGWQAIPATRQLNRPAGWQAIPATQQLNRPAGQQLAPGTNPHESGQAKASVTKFDLVFLDPPYASDLLLPTCQLLASARVLAPTAKIYLEAASPIAANQLPPSWQLLRQKQAGEVHYALAVAGA